MTADSEVSDSIVEGHSLILGMRNLRALIQPDVWLIFCQFPRLFFLDFPHFLL